MNRPSDLVRLLRPHEWTKNGFVFTGLLFGHGLRDIALVYQVIIAAAAIISYSLYAVSPDAIRIHGTEHLIYTVPLIMYGLFRYLYLLYHCGVGADPARELARDPHMLFAGSAWLLVTLWLIT